MVLLCGCANEAEKKIVGKWQELHNPKGALHFNKDHSGHAYWPDEVGGQQDAAMTWSYQPKENTVTVVTPPGPVVFQFKGDRLLAPNGVELTKLF